MLIILDLKYFRIWRRSDKRFDYYFVGEDAQQTPGDVIQLGFTVAEGKEIYEGDIVIADSHGTIDFVVFEDGCFCLEHAAFHYEATYWGREIKVIGNIFEGVTQS